MTKLPTFSQPIIWQDLADTDLIRVGNAYYYSASTMHFSPGAPILRSYDLVNWEYIAHSVPRLEFGDERFDLENGNAYNLGIYASTLRYHECRGLFYWVGCAQYTGRSYIYAASEITGPWKLVSTIRDCVLYDAGLLIDDDGTMYVAYSKWIPKGDEAKIRIAELDGDTLQIKRNEVVFNTTKELDYIEGARFYKRNGIYYLWLTNPGINVGGAGGGQIIVKSSDGPFGPYGTWHRVLANNGHPVEGGGPPFQGAIVDTPAGDWWYIAFIDKWPGGRFPVLAPITWDEDGWPNVQFVDGDKWGSSYQYPLPPHPVKPLTGIDRFQSELGYQYEWNHNPDNSKWQVDNGLTLQTATITDDFFSAKNTLTHRVLGPTSTATIELDYANMAEGDKAGLSVFRWNAGWIGVSKTQGEFVLEMVDKVDMEYIDEKWVTVKKGEVVERTVLKAGKIWIRAHCDLTGGRVRAGTSTSQFSYSHDGNNFTNFGCLHYTGTGKVFFLGMRYGLFNFATKALGGSVKIQSFTLEN